VGGTGKLVEELANKVSEAGGEILTDTSVISVDSQAHEVVLSDGQKAGYKKLVWAADQNSLYQIVSGTSDSKVQKQRALTEAGKGSDSIYTLFLGADLEKDYVKERIGTHAFYTPDTQGMHMLGSWESAAEQGNNHLLEWVGSYLEKTTYEISCPSLRDPSLAPEGKTGMVISSLMDYSLVKRFSDAGQYEEFKQFCNQKIIEVLEKHLLPNLSKKTLFSFSSTPMTIERRTGSKQGAITGWAFTNPNMPSENRFKTMGKSIRTPIRDVLQCGQWTFSPSGVPISVMTGKMAADAVIKALKR
jgi:phytoene dehydrogenase-like protein